MTYVPGIDVSYWEGGIDWKKVRGAGIRFMFTKATEGEGYEDPTLDDNWLGAKSVGILRGAYHFFHPNMNPVKQADHFIQAVKKLNDNGELPPVLDLEVSDNQPTNTIIDRAKTWLDRVMGALGKRPMIYSGPGFLKYSFVVPGGGPPLWTKDYVLWIANYEVDKPYLPKGWLKWTFWQYSEKGQVDGINATVDLNWFNGTVEELYQFAGAQPPGATTYKVKRGDTLQSIANQFGLSLSELVDANPQLIQPNMVLKIPEAVDVSATTDNGTTDISSTEEVSGGGTNVVEKTYTVKSGDTLSGIALKFGTTYGLIAQLNGIAPPYVIHPGQELKIP
jgi:GH25 family lysozyme M1 (1,4-beta-N-acetylmuramidase)/LysM repeat protein